MDFAAPPTELSLRVRAREEMVRPMRGHKTYSNGRVDLHHACQGDAQQVWAAPASHPSTTLVRDIAVWRAANGINPQDPRPTGGTQLETLPALWKQRLDRDIARATNPPADARADKPHAGRTALSPRDDRQRPYQQPERRPSRPSAPGR